MELIRGNFGKNIVVSVYCLDFNSILRFSSFYFELVSITRSYSKTLKSQWLIILRLKSIYFYTRNRICLQNRFSIRNLYDRSEENPKRSRAMCRIKTLNLQIPPNSGFYCTNLVLCLRVPISANKRRLILNSLRRYF